MTFIIVTVIIILAVLAAAVFAAIFFIQSKQRKDNSERGAYTAPSVVSKPVNNPPGGSINNPVNNPMSKQPVNASSGNTEYLFSGQTEVLEENSFLVTMKETTSSGERELSVVINDEVTVGRLETNGICVNDPTVSRLQCVFTIGAGSVCVRNSSNSNVTRLNGNPILGTVPISAGDTIAFGEVRFDIQDIKTA